MKNIDVQVLMYHSVGIPNEKWEWNYLTCPFEIFENQLEVLKKNGYNTISLEQLYDYMFKGSTIPEKSVVLTFDDGYLDNWQFAFPILKKFGMCGTVFVNPEFVDKRSIVRKRFDQVEHLELLEPAGFLSWEELRIMESECVFDVQSHAMTHTWYFKSQRIIDFRHPSDPYIWITWNQNKSKKPFLQVDNHKLVFYGQPIYEFEKSLSCSRYYPDEKLDKYLINFAKKNPKVFEGDYKKTLFSLVEKFKSDNLIEDNYETHQDYLLRIENELFESKVIIEKELKKEVFFLCWPGGSGTKEGMEIAIKLGYRFFSVAQDLELSQRRKIRNTINSKNNRVARLTPIVYAVCNSKSQYKVKYSSGKYLLFQIKAREYRGILFYFLKCIDYLVKIFKK